MKKSAIIVFLALVIQACGPDEPVRPPGTLSEEKFTAVMIDVQLNEGMRSQRKMRDRQVEVDAKNYQAIFKKHGISKEEFLTTFGFYREHPGEMELVYEAVLDSLSTLEAEIKQAFTADQNARRDSINEAQKKIRKDLKGLKIQE